MKVTLVGCAYLADENRKCLDVLAEKVQLEVISPNSIKGMIYDLEFGEESIAGKGWTMRLYRKWFPPMLPPSCYLLATIDLGLGAFRPDVVHIEADPFTPLFMQVLLLTKKASPSSRIVCTIKQNTFTSRGFFLDWAKTAVARLLVPRVDRFIAVNSGVAEIYRDRFGVRAERISYCTHLGVDTDLFAPSGAVPEEKYRLQFSLERGDCLIGYCGRFVDYKGIPELIDAISFLREETGKDLRLVLLGKGPMREELLKRRESMQWLTVLDSVPHALVADFLKGIDMFAMPSRILRHHVEHDAHALLEAMATGIPCIGAASGAIVDVLPGAGLVVPPEESRELAGAVLKLLENEPLRLELGRAGRERVVNDYSLHAVADRYADVYRQIVE